MKINKLTASFGKLNNDSIEFHDGLNVINAPNESGKSTWCAFMRDMLYGVDSSERAKAGYLPDKVKYAPWSGAPMEGTMELTAGGRDITITRTTRTKSGPMREFSAVYTGTNVPVPGLEASNAGEKLTGVTREVFRRSAFVEQGALAVSGSPELEKRIASIVTTGEEGMSYSEADERLRSWQRSRRFNRRGRLPELEERIAEGKRGMDGMDRSAAERETLRVRLDEAEKNCSRLEQSVNDSRKQYRRDALDTLTKSRGELNRASDTYKELYTRARADRAALQHCVLGELEPTAAAEQVKRDKARCDELSAAANAKISHAGTIMLALLAAAAAAAAIVFGSGSAVLMAACAAVFLGALAGMIFCMRSERAKRTDARKKAAERLEILDRYDAGSEADISAALEEFKGLYAACMASEQEAEDAEGALEEKRKRQEALESTTLSELDFTNGSTEAARLGRELSDARREKERLAGELARLEGGMEAMGDPLVMRSSIESMESEYEEIKREYDAISLAVEVLRSADSELQSRFSPELGRKAAEYMSVMTGGKYNSLLINRDFTARAGASDGSPAREAEYLSAGTLDLLYLAVRLAVCELAMPEGEKCPLILDDALVNFDSEREAQAMKLLGELAKERQMILFSCRDEEKT